MLTALLFLLGFANVGALCWVGWRLGDVLAYSRHNASEASEAKAFFRSRVSRASMQSGATTIEKDMKHAGRASTGRRVVFGGDPESQLHKDLTVDDSARQSRPVSRRSGGTDDG